LVTLKNKNINEQSRQVLTVDSFWQNLQQNNFPSESNIILAYSGGCDSHVLLHLLVQLKKQLHINNIRVVHINHQLHSESTQWAEHCLQECAEHNVDCDVIKVAVDSTKGKGIEAAARHARYQALEQYIKEDTLLVTAQHADDQTETFLLQSLRGSGVKGLSAMPYSKPFAKGHLLRPLLFFSQAQITNYAKKHNLNWLEDPSNIDTNFDRNYLRKEVIPRLKHRWPQLDRSYLQVAEYQAEAASLLNDLAELDLSNILDEQGLLSIDTLSLLSVSRMKNVIRYWIFYVKNFTMPDGKHLDRIIFEVLPAADDAQPCVHWENVIVRRFNNKLYADFFQAGSNQTIQEVLNWAADKTFEIPREGGRLSKVVTTEKIGKGLSISRLQDKHITIQFRQGGEVCSPQGRGPQQHKLKKLFQEWQVPPWQRNQVPLIYVEDKLAQVVGYCLCEPFVADDNEPAYRISVE